LRSHPGRYKKSAVPAAYAKEAPMRAVGMLTTGLLVISGVIAAVFAVASRGDMSRYLRMRRM
jgi:hypothetical protein